MRAACILIPSFAVRLEQRDRPELRRAPVVVGGAPGDRRAVLDCSPQARRWGVRPGMALRQALALCRDAVFVDPHPARYAETFAAILDALERFSPRVQPAEPGCAFLDLDGTGRLWPDEPPLARAMQEAVRGACRLIPRAGIADGLFAARCAAALTTAPQRARGGGESLRSAMAEHDGPGAIASAMHDPAATPSAGRRPPTEDGRHGDAFRPVIVPPGEAAAFLAPLPVELLPVSAEMGRRLRLLGLRTLANLAALPAGAVQAQFGREGLRAWRLASGNDDAPLIPRTRAVDPEEHLDLPAPTADLGALERAAGLLLRRIFRRPEVAGRLARRLTLRITLEDGRAWERAITFHDATADVDTALFAVRSRLAALELPAAAVAITLVLHDLCGERGRQERLFSAAAPRIAQIDEAIRHLESGLGTIPVLRLMEVEPWSRIPERRHALTEYNP